MTALIGNVAMIATWLLVLAAVVSASRRRT